MKVLEGSESNQVCKLDEALYGLKQDADLKYLNKI